jgi:glycosyltransferase involved in cell wall biosynthesis
MLEDYKPDIVHVHLLHGYYINYKMLFDYFKKNNIRVFWTMHDCWAFTGHCPCYTHVQCYKWKEYCHDCVQKKQHPKSYFVDRSRRNFEDKKNAFTGVSNMTIITPSNWLKEEIQKSFLNEYNITVIPNGVDLSIFHPTDNYFRKKHGLNDKIIILGVANVWSESKGIAYFYQLANKICDDRFQIVMVGLSKKQKKQIHSGIIGIERTKNIEMLADIYSSSDIFLNPTMADNFPTTNLEALACGTPIITFKTGGSPEALDNTCGMVIESDINAIMHTCKTMGRKNEQTIKNCVNRAKRFDKKICYIDYLKLYERDMH